MGLLPRVNKPNSISSFMFPLQLGWEAGLKQSQFQAPQGTLRLDPLQEAFPWAGAAAIAGIVCPLACDCS